MRCKILVQNEKMGWVYYLATVTVNGAVVAFKNKIRKTYFDTLDAQELLDIALAMAEMYTNTLDDVNEWGKSEMFSIMDITEGFYCQCESLHRQFVKAFGEGYQNLF